MKTRRVFLLLSLLCTVAVVSGCLIGTASSTTHTGTHVAESTFDQIKPGSSTIGWVRATLGDPTSRTIDGDDQVWKYTYTEHTDSSGYIFLIFGGANSTEKTNTVFIEFKNGVVANNWRG